MKVANIKFEAFSSITYLGLHHIFQAKQANGGVVDNGLYEAMRKELRHAVEEIRVELEQVCEIPSFSLVQVLLSSSK